MVASEAKPPTRPTRLSRRSSSARGGEYEALTIRLGTAAHPRAVAVLGNGPTRTDDVRSSLDADEALLDYLVTSDRVIVFVVTRAGLTVVQRAIEPSVLTQRVRLLHDLWGSPTTDWKWGLERREGAR